MGTYSVTTDEDGFYIMYTTLSNKPVSLNKAHNFP